MKGTIQFTGLRTMTLNSSELIVLPPPEPPPPPEPAPPPPPQLMTEKEVCAWLNTSKRNLFCWRTAKLIPFIKIGRAVRFRAADVQRALDSMTIQPNP
jgi:excisionase family DNA binding protein